MAQKKKHSAKGNARHVTLSDNTKRILLASCACVLAGVGCWWAYFKFTTIAPPDLKTAPPAKVSGYLGDVRGFPRLSTAGRAEFLGNMWKQYGDGPKRDELARSFERMSSSERQVFVDAAFEMVKVDFLQKASEFKKVPNGKRTEFLDSVINQLDMQRSAIAGGPSHGGGGSAGGPAIGGGSRASLTKPFEGAIPNTSDGMTKALVTRTSPSQRAKAQPLFDALTARYKEREEMRKTGR